MKKIHESREESGTTVNDYRQNTFLLTVININFGLESNIELEGHTFKIVSYFKYLGSIKIQENDVKFRELRTL